MPPMRVLKRDQRAVSSFSLLAIILLLFSSFTVSYLSYTSRIDSEFRLGMEDISKMEFKTREILNDLEVHATYLAEQAINHHHIGSFEDDYDDFMDRMGQEGFDIWLGGDIRAVVDGVYAVYGGTIKENYTVSLDVVDGVWVVSGSFNTTIKNLRTDIVLHKVLKFSHPVELFRPAGHLRP